MPILFLTVLAAFVIVQFLAIFFASKVYTARVDAKLAAGREALVVPPSKKEKTFRLFWRLAAIVWLACIIGLGLGFLYESEFSPAVSVVVGFLYVGFVSAISAVSQATKGESRWRLVIFWPVFLVDLILSMFTRNFTEETAAPHGGL